MTFRETDAQELKSVLPRGAGRSSNKRDEHFRVLGVGREEGEEGKRQAATDGRKGSGAGEPPGQVDRKTETSKPRSVIVDGDGFERSLVPERKATGNPSVSMCEKPMSAGKIEDGEGEPRRELAATETALEEGEATCRCPMKSLSR